MKVNDICEPKEFAEFSLNGQISTFWRSLCFTTSMDKVITDQTKSKEKIK